MKLVVGLGNPGQKYNGTRHNIGFEVIAELAKRHFSGRPRSRFNGEIAEILINNEKVLLTCPLTFMNLSGQFVRSMVDFYKLEIDQIMVLCDDINLPVAKLRIRPKGTDGGQKGLRDIINRLGSNEVPRLRIGIGPTPEQWAVPDFVLGKFDEREREEIDQAVVAAANAIECWVSEDIGQAMNRFNSPSEKRKKPGKDSETQEQSESPENVANDASSNSGRSKAAPSTDSTDNPDLSNQ